MNRKNKILIRMSAAVLALLILAVLVGPLLSPYNYAQQNVNERLLAPSLHHPMGTDRYGRDILTRVLVGGRITIFSSLLALVIVMSLGFLVGTIMGMNRGKALDLILMRVMDTLVAFPFMILAMLISSFWGTGLDKLLLSIIFVWWIPFAKVSRSMAGEIMSETSVEASKVLGFGPVRVMVRELFPRIFPVVLVQATFECANLILSLSALSFLGLGVKPPVPEWGSMMSDGRAHFMQYPHLIMGPAIAIMLFVFFLNVLGENIRDLSDPYERIPF